MNVRIIIPNSTMGSAKIKNSTYSKGVCYHITVTIPYVNKEKRYKIMQIMEEVVTNHPLFYDNRTEEQVKLDVKTVETTYTSLGQENIVYNNRACRDCSKEILID